jgi:hypothetical protein
MQNWRSPVSDVSSTAIRLKSGVKIAIDNGLPTVDRFSLSDGSIEIDPDLYPQYSHPAFIPKLPWRQPTRIENESLINATDIQERSETIAIVKFPEAAISNLKNSIVWGEREYGESVTAKEIIAHPDYASARLQIQEYILSKYALAPEIDCRELICCNVDLPTSTINAIEYLPAKPFAGLHLDSWDYLPFRRRHLARNRICINLGREVRYFLLINLTLKQIFDELNLVDPDDIYQDYRGVRLPSKFMQAFPDYPVVRLAVHPGEAYIAPTENFIHDATTIGKTLTDWNITFLGNFKI